MPGRFSRNFIFGLIPTFITFLNLGFGFLSLAFSFEGQWQAAFSCMILGAICDFLDGLLARILGVSSKLGEALDSLADLVTFGLAPCFFVLLKGFESEPRFYTPSLFFGFFFFASAAYRLARFQVQKSEAHFVGLPLPMACFGLIGLYGIMPGVWSAAFYFSILGVLMVSRIPFFSFKKKPGLSVLIGIFGLFISGFVNFAFVLGIGFTIYLAGSLGFGLFYRKTR